MSNNNVLPCNELSLHNTNLSCSSWKAGPHTSSNKPPSLVLDEGVLDEDVGNADVVRARDSFPRPIIQKKRERKKTKQRKEDKNTDQSVSQFSTILSCFSKKCFKKIGKMIKEEKEERNDGNRKYLENLSTADILGIRTRRRCILEDHHLVRIMMCLTLV